RMASLDDNSDSEIPALSADVLALVNQVKLEQAEREQAAAEGSALPEEDWQLSQFWYSEETAVRLCEEIAAVCGDLPGEVANVALLSTPTLLPYFKKLEGFRSGRLRVKLFENDTRFGAIHPDEFVEYDYKTPLNVPSSLHSHFDFVCADPPFLAQECMRGFAETIRLIGKPEAKVLVCTGATMEDTVGTELGARRTPFSPSHANNLSNDFASYANYEVNTLSK
ncbi:hypothetical protein PENTCL1PPCAC_9990, partial [Pristionchus entomophagus]